LEKRLGQKTRHVTLGEKGVIEEDILPDKSSTSCLRDEEVREIGKIGKILEKHFEDIPQDVERAVDRDLSAGNNLFLLQTRPAVITSKKSTTERILNLMMSRLHQR
jgi:pyruvate,water dikinase